MLLTFKDNAAMKGKYRIRSFEAGTDKLIYDSGWIENQIVSSDTYGRNLIMRQLAGDTTYPIEIDSFSMGTGNTAVTDADNDLDTPTSEGHVISTADVTNDELLLGIFMPDANLPNATYQECGLKCNGRLFTRSLITPTFSKSAGQDVTIQYLITLN